jgi:adenylate cyclase class IV
MIEKEIKILDINYTQLTKELESLGAKKKNACLIRDWYFDYDDKKLRKE